MISYIVSFGVMLSVFIVYLIVYYYEEMVKELDQLNLDDLDG
jgi:hypothetical protein